MWRINQIIHSKTYLTVDFILTTGLVLNTKALSEVCAPITRSGYELPSKSSPPETDHPKLLKGTCVSSLALKNCLRNKNIYWISNDNNNVKHLSLSNGILVACRFESLLGQRLLTLNIA